MAPLVVHYPPPVPLSLESRDLIISALLSTSAVTEINTQLLTACQASGWADAVRQRTRQLLRSGECATYKEVMNVLRREALGELDEKTPKQPPNGDFHFDRNLLDKRRASGESQNCHGEASVRMKVTSDENNSNTHDVIRPISLMDDSTTTQWQCSR